MVTNCTRKWIRRTIWYGSEWKNEEKLEKNEGCFVRWSRV